MIKKLLLMALVAVTFASCSNKTSQESADNQNLAVAVDSLLANPDNYVDKEVTIEGAVSHLCAHGGRKAFILGSDENTMIRCDATAEMGGAFPKDVIHTVIRVKGKFVEERLDEAGIRELEAQHAQMVSRVAEQDGEEAAQTAATATSGCETERKAAGQAEVESFNAQMADYRARIADRNTREGKPYLSFYSIQATSYTPLQD